MMESKVGLTSLDKIKIGAIFVIALFPYVEFLITGNSIILP